MKLKTANAAIEATLDGETDLWAGIRANDATSSVRWWR